MRCALLLRAVLATALMALGLVTISPTAHAAPGDSLGTDFWVSFPTNFQGSQGLQLFVTGPTATTGTLEIPGLSHAQQFTVTPGTATKLVLPTSAELTVEDGIEQKGIHVTTAHEVSVYGLNRVQGSTDAFLALPTDVLDSQYIVLSYSGLGSGFAEHRGSQFSVAATQDGTVLTITPSVAIGSHGAGQPYQVTMNAGDAYQLHSLTDVDLTGTIVASNHPVGVFAGSRCSNVPAFTNYCDHLVEQLSPPSTWGKKFVTQPLATRINGDVFRVLAATDATHVTINGSQVATLDRGQVFETTLTTASTITTDQPVLVGQYSQSTAVDGVTSDPFVMLIPPYEQFLSAYTITTPDAQFGFSNYVNVVAPTADVGLVKADGAAIPAASFQPIPGSTFSGAQLAVSSGSHTYEGPSPFGVYVYGFAAADSYGYPGGMQLAPVATVSTVTLSLASGSAVLGDQACTTATVLDQYGNPVPNVRVDFTVAGANTSSGSLTADATGTAEFCYDGSAAGSDTVTATVGTVTGTATLTWVSPDTTAPSLTGTPTTEPNAAGWYSGDVHVHWTATDDADGSGIDPTTVPDDSVITGEGEGLTASASVSDIAGNTTTASSTAVNIDRTAPTTSVDAPTTWSNGRVDVVLTAHDGLSGPASTTWQLDDGPRQTATDMPSTTVPVTTEGVHTLMFFSTDKAGNEQAPQHVAIRVDSSAPSIEHDAAPAANANGWNNSDVTVTFSCTDTGSGVASCLAALDEASASAGSPFTVTGDGAHQVHLSAADHAGNTASTGVAVNVDATKPTITGEAPEANANGWHSSPIPVTFTCNDEHSGVAECSGSQTLSSEGVDLSASGSATDAAGNTASATVGGLKLDQTAPSITGAAATAPNDAGWYNAPVVVHFACSDALSGVAACPADTTLSGDGADQSVDGMAHDKADNTAAAHVDGINIDRTAPTISASVSPATPSSGWFTGSVTVRFTCTDAGSGVASCPDDVTVTQDGEGQSVSGTVTDNAGNSSSITVEPINIDTVAPTITFAGHSGRYTVDQTVAITCAATDALSGIDTASCPSVSGPAHHYLGENTLTATASDKAGNTAVASVRFVVAVTADSLCTLTRQLVTTPNDANAFCVKLSEGQVGAYQNAVMAASGKSVTPANARLLIELSKKM